MRRGLAVVGVAVALGVSACGADVRRATPASSDAADGAARIARAFELRERGVPVEAAGEVVRLLPDDRDGSRHQRFVLRLATGQTLLVAHNVDLAPRVEGLERGDRVAFRGEYEWSEEGGVVHWTHRDPAGVHPGGWLRFAGRTYD